MRDDLRAYYERELSFVRQMGAEFAAEHPKMAGRLLLEPGESKDPHVERLIEAFAFLAARVHLKVDDEFPEITEALLTTLYPHYLRPVPSMTVVEFELDPEKGKLTTGLKIERGSMLYPKRAKDERSKEERAEDERAREERLERERFRERIKFRTCYDVTLWPFGVSEAQWGTPDRLHLSVPVREAMAYLKVELTCLPDVTFDKLELRTLRFGLHGEDKLQHALYELLCNNCIQIWFRNPSTTAKAQPVVIAPESLRPMGFSEDEALLPYPMRSFDGYRLLQEYFTFPNKFFFFELEGFTPELLQRFKDKLEIIFFIRPFERTERQQELQAGVTREAVRLGSTPVINLFQGNVEPVLLDQLRPEYPVVPDARQRNAAEVFSVDEVSITNPRTHETTAVEPMYSVRRPVGVQKEQVFWHTTRRYSVRPGDEGTDVFISLVDKSSRPVLPESDALSLRCTCSNRDIPSRLPFGRPSGDFEVDGVPSIKRVVALRKPSDAVRPPLGTGAFWRLISHLSLNYLSLVEGGSDALKEILKLYNFSEVPDLAKQIDGITDVASHRQFARVFSDNGVSFVRGTGVTIEFDEEHFTGGGVYLFARVLEHFLALYASLNSFTQLTARTMQRREALRAWPPRAGRVILV